MKKLVTIAVSIVVVIAVLAFAKDMVIKMSVEKGVELVTGLKLSMGTLRVGIIKTLVDIRNLRLFNPANFKDRVMLDMPEIYVAYDLPALMKGKVHLSEARIALKEFVVVKNEKGELNLDSLKVVQAQKQGKRPAAKEAGKIPKIQIDSLRLKIKRVVYKDYTAGKEPRVTEYKINIDEQYKNITDPYSLVSLIVVKALMNTAIANLTDFDLQGLQGTVSDTLAGAQKAAMQAVSTAAEAMKQTGGVAQQGMQTATEAARKTGEAVQGAASALTDVFKNPFGSDKK